MPESYRPTTNPPSRACRPTSLLHFAVLAVVRAAIGLYGVGSTDPVSYALGGALLLGVSIVACLVPMGRAMRVDPLTTMRAE